MDEGDARELVLSAIAAGINNDLGSGSNIDVCVITSDRGLEHHRGVWKDPGLDCDESPANGQGDDGGCLCHGLLLWCTASTDREKLG